MNNYDSISTEPTEFYRYAYTELLHRYVVASCDKVIESVDVLQHDIESLLKDTQELIYNCTPAEVEAIKAITQEPVKDVEACAQNLAETLSALQQYKSAILASEDLL